MSEIFSNGFANLQAATKNEARVLDCIDSELEMTCFSSTFSPPLKPSGPSKSIFSFEILGTSLTEFIAGIIAVSETFDDVNLFDFGDGASVDHGVMFIHARSGAGTSLRFRRYFATRTLALS